MHAGKLSQVSKKNVAGRCDVDPRVSLTEPNQSRRVVDCVHSVPEAILTGRPSVRLAGLVAASEHVYL